MKTPLTHTLSRCALALFGAAALFGASAQAADGGQAHALIGAQVADHVAVVGMQGCIAVDVEVVAFHFISRRPSEFWISKTTTG